MSVQVIDNFSYKGKKGNFERDNFDTLQAMRSYPEDGIDDGHVCFCNEDGNHYKFNHLNSVDGATGRWRLHNKSVNTLTETGEGKVLDARQGKILKDLIDAKVIEAGGVSFDTVPTKGSTNPVTSNGIKEAMDEQAKSINSNTGVDDYPVFSASEAYSKGKVVNYNGKLYQFTSDHAAGAWIGDDVEKWSLKDKANDDNILLSNGESQILIKKRFTSNSGIHGFTINFQQTSDKQYTIKLLSVTNEITSASFSIITTATEYSEPLNKNNDGTFTAIITGKSSGNATLNISVNSTDRVEFITYIIDGAVLSDVVYQNKNDIAELVEEQYDAIFKRLSIKGTDNTIGELSLVKGLTYTVLIKTDENINSSNTIMRILDPERTQEIYKELGAVDISSGVSYEITPKKSGKYTFNLQTNGADDFIAGRYIYILVMKKTTGKVEERMEALNEELESNESGIEEIGLTVGSIGNNKILQYSYKENTGWHTQEKSFTQRRGVLYTVMVRQNDMSSVGNVTLRIKGVENIEVGNIYSILKEDEYYEYSYIASSDGEATISITRNVLDASTNDIDVVVRTKNIAERLRELESAGIWTMNAAISANSNINADSGHAILPAGKYRISITSDADIVAANNIYIYLKNGDENIRRLYLGNYLFKDAAPFTFNYSTDSDIDIYVNIQIYYSDSDSPAEGNLIVSIEPLANRYDEQPDLVKGTFNNSGKYSSSEVSYVTNPFYEDGLLIVTMPDTMKCTFYSRINGMNSYYETIETNFSVKDGMYKLSFTNKDGTLPSEEDIQGIRFIHVNTNSESYDICVASSNSSEKDRNTADLIVDADNCTETLQAIVSCLTSIKILLYGGIYNVTKFNTLPLDGGTQNFAIHTLMTVPPQYPADDPMEYKRLLRMVEIYGYSAGRNSESVAKLVVSEDLYNSVDSKTVAIIGVPMQTEDIGQDSNESYTKIALKNIAIFNWGYEKPIIDIDLTSAGYASLENINIANIEKNFGQQEAFATTPNENFIGIRVGQGSNNGVMNYLKHCVVMKCSTGFSCNGEHFVFEDCLSWGNMIGFAFGDKKVRKNLEHPNVMIGCSIEACYRFMTLSKQGIKEQQEYVEDYANNIIKSTLVCIGLSTENGNYRPVGTTGQTTKSLPVIEYLKGCYRGRIEGDSITAEEGSCGGMNITTY